MSEDMDTSTTKYDEETAEKELEHVDLNDPPTSSPASMYHIPDHDVLATNDKGQGTVSDLATGLLPTAASSERPPSQEDLKGHSGPPVAHPPNIDASQSQSRPPEEAIQLHTSPENSLHDTSETVPSTARSSLFDREIEEAAAVAATAAREAAALAQQKLRRGMEEAKAFVSSFWSSLEDEDHAGKGGKGTTQLQGEGGGDEKALQASLGLDDGEIVLETFRCKILQRYHPMDNDFTPTKVIAFSGQFTIASASVVFELDSGAADGRPPVRVPRASLEKFYRMENDSHTIMLQLKNGQQMVLGKFSFPRLEIDSCLALLEQLLETPQS